jgi:hypothetical protein
LEYNLSVTVSHYYLEYIVTKCFDRFHLTALNFIESKNDPTPRYITARCVDLVQVDALTSDDNASAFSPVTFISLGKSGSGKI